MDFYFVAILCALICERCSAISPTENYHHKVQLRPNEGYTLYWKYDDEYITFEVHAETIGWVGFGLSPNGGMAGSDIVVGWVPSNGGQAILTDRHATGQTEPIIDEEQNYELLDSSQTDTHTMLKFKRKLVLCDKNDVTITDNTHKIIWAVGITDGDSLGKIRKHFTMGVQSILFLSMSETSQEKPVDAVYVDVLNTNIPIPSSKTSYWCRIMKLEPEPTKKHIFMIEPIVKEENKGIVHHILVFGCYGGIPANAHLTEEWDCAKDEMPNYYNNGSYHCETTLFAWGIGAEEFWFPEEIGFPWYDRENNSPTFLRMETHFDNQDQRTDLTDTSGLRLWMTETLRPQDAGMLRTGVSAWEAQQIPPKYEKFVSQGHCHSDCTKMAIDQPVTLFAVILHTHLLGTAITVHHYRDGKELSVISKDDYYDFNYQEARVLKKPVQFRPGDSLMVECVYDSTGRTQKTVGGLETEDEMCYAFFSYYPANNWEGCESFPTITQSLTAFDLDINQYDIVTSGKYADKRVSQVFSPIIEETDWSDMNMRNKFQYAVNAEGGNMFIQCDKNGHDLFADLPKTRPVPSYIPAPAAIDQCYVSGAPQSKISLNAFVVITIGLFIMSHV